MSLPLESLVLMDGDCIQSYSCRRLTENVLTIGYFDHTAILIGCPHHMAEEFLAEVDWGQVIK